METFEAIINYLLTISVGISVIRIYLILNKIWKRKHKRVVAESISIGAQILAYFTTTSLLLSLLLVSKVEWHLAHVVYFSTKLVSTTIFLLIGTGLWVMDQRKHKIWKLFIKALRLERKEVGYLVKSFLHTTGTDQILRILGQFAMIDKVLDEREKIFIDSFAREWNIKYSIEELTKDRDGDSRVNYITLRQSVVDYLAAEPPPEQVAQFEGVLIELMHIDEKIAEEEELIIDEIRGLFDRYLYKSESTEITDYMVVIAPQNDEQDQAIQALLPNVARQKFAGGFVYAGGVFHSLKYAKMICKKYRELNLLTFIETKNSNS